MRNRKLGHYFIIEAKGEGQGFATEAKKESMITALGQLALRFTSHNGRRYGLAFPERWRKRVLGKLTPAIVSQYKLNIFFVDQRGGVIHLTPRSLKRLVKESRPTRIEPK